MDFIVLRIRAVFDFVKEMRAGIFTNSSNIYEKKKRTLVYSTLLRLTCTHTICLDYN